MTVFRVQVFHTLTTPEYHLTLLVSTCRQQHILEKTKQQDMTHCHTLSMEKMGANFQPSPRLEMETPFHKLETRSLNHT